MRLLIIIFLCCFSFETSFSQQLDTIKIHIADGSTHGTDDTIIYDVNTKAIKYTTIIRGAEDIVFQKTFIFTQKKVDKLKKRDVIVYDNKSNPTNLSLCIKVGKHNFCNFPLLCDISFFDNPEKIYSSSEDIVATHWPEVIQKINNTKSISRVYTINNLVFFHNGQPFKINGKYMLQKLNDKVLAHIK